jgi:hypothetical protein
MSYPFKWALQLKGAAGTILVNTVLVMRGNDAQSFLGLDRELVGELLCAARNSTFDPRSTLPAAWSTGVLEGYLPR